MKPINVYIVLGEDGIVGVAKTWQGASNLYTAEFLFEGETRYGKAKGVSGASEEFTALRLAGFVPLELSQNFTVLKIPTAKKTGIVEFATQ